MLDMLRGLTLVHGARLQYARAPSGSWSFVQWTSVFHGSHHDAVSPCVRQRCGGQMHAEAPGGFAYPGFLTLDPVRIHPQTAALVEEVRFLWWPNL